MARNSFADELRDSHINVKIKFGEQVLCTGPESFMVYENIYK